ncbi:regulatory protein GemA [Sedimentitalea sp. JM2-8]|uniref:Regulatory protein GemA n=1 Tax=Sedimentitalea xiamensis TaxID=3050037 RepID=A0ABT7FLS2_9RHOB|nr:regulatory protein GemA [Sedimentitalea xiamensis]MDK3075960.1 regulatory protein GemA [Sedimentitalea xiamensis]
MPITRNQQKLIFVARSRLRLTEAQYRAALVEIGGVSSVTELDIEGFEALMGVFEYLGFAPATPKGRSFGDRPGMATIGQIELIRALWQEYTRGKAGEDALGKWLEHYWQVSSLRFLRKETAPRIITALKAMKARAA